jgi:hypothetical protein
MLLNTRCRHLIPRYLIGLPVREIRAGTVREAGAGVKVVLTNEPHVKKIRLSLDPTSPELKPWLEAVKIKGPERRGGMVQAFFTRVFCEAGYDITVGKEFDILARGSHRSYLVEVKSSLEGGKFGSEAILTQLDGYSMVDEGRGADVWLGTMGIKRPILLSVTFRTELYIRNIGHIDARWVSPKESLLLHF